MRKYIVWPILFLLTLYSIAACQGDADKDTDVDLFDLIIVAINFGKTSNFDVRADLNFDDAISLQDLILVAKDFGKTNCDVPTGECTDISYGTMLMDTASGAWITPFDVMLYAHNQGVRGMVAAGAPSDNARDNWFSKLPGWTRAFIRGTYDQLTSIHQAATIFNMQDMYECIAYGPEYAHSAADEALNPEYYVPLAESIAQANNKCLVYGPAVCDYEIRADPNLVGQIGTQPQHVLCNNANPQDSILESLITPLAPHVDIWAIQLGKYQPITDRGQDYQGNPFTMVDFEAWITKWVNWIKTANPNAKVWTQMGVGSVDPISKKCGEPQPLDYFVEYRDVLARAGVDGIWGMPGQPCQPCPPNPSPGFICSTDPQDHEYYRQSLERFQELIGQACTDQPSETICNDNIDNDNDGYTDCQDSDCALYCAPPEIETICNDGIDNDNDGQIDCNDGDCYYSTYCTQDSQYTDCSVSELGASLMTDNTMGDSTGPELVQVAQQGITGMAGTLTYDTASEYFPQLPGWELAQICNSLECLQTRVDNANRDGLAYDYLSYGPERLGGVPEWEKTHLPEATAQARQIADNAGKKLQISYSTKQLHQEALERGYGWDNPGQVVNLLAPYGDFWLIQAADEFNNPNNQDYGNYGPILSQRHYEPGPEWRAEVEKWVNWIRAANPNIEIWIQMAFHRIGFPEEAFPSAELVLEYREWLVAPEHGPPLVDGVFLSSIYSWAIDSVAADQELIRAFQLACRQDSPPPPEPECDDGFDNDADGLIDMNDPGCSSTQDDDETDPGPPIPVGQISLVEEGWTDNLVLSSLTIHPGFYYRVYENSKYPCGSGGNHQFVVYDTATSTTTNKNLFAKFPGGAVGFYFYDGGQKLYYPNERAIGLLTQKYNYNTMIRTAVSSEYANGLTRKIRERMLSNGDFRISVPSYCSHDLYLGRGQCNDVDGFCRYGYLAAMEAIDFVQQTFNTNKIITHGGSAGAANFFVAKDQDNVAGIIMDSFSGDLSAVSDSCHSNTPVFGQGHLCFCPDQTCMEILTPRIGFTFGVDEPHHVIERGFNTPIYLVWNERDASINAPLLYNNLHNAIEQYNPGGNSVANKVCITNPDTPPGPICNLHVPSAYDYPDTTALVDEMYNWAIARVS